MSIESTAQQIYWGLQGIQTAVSGHTTDLNRIANALERIASVMEERRPTVIWKVGEGEDQS